MPPRRESNLETPLTPLEFARRARKLYADREAVVDGVRRLTYGQFFERCDRASAALARLGVGKGDRVATIAPNTLAHLDQFYAVPQLGAVVVPLNYRLIADDFVYLINHSGARVVCAHSDYLEMVDGIRARCPAVEHWVALEGTRSGWLDYESLLALAGTEFPRAAVAESDLLAINYTSGTTSKPKGVMITHRNAWVNAVGTLIHHPMSTADRYLWTLPMFHANGWTFVWIVTAAGGTHVCLRKVEPARRLRAGQARAHHHVVRGTDGADRHRQRARGDAPRRPARRARGDGRRAARRRDDRARREQISAGPSRMSMGSPRPRR